MINRFQHHFKKIKEEHNDDGFTLMEAVIAIAMILALSVGGVVVYGQINKNAKMASYRSFADELYVVAVNARSTGDPNEIFSKVDEWGEEKGYVLYINEKNPNKCIDQVVLLDVDMEAVENGEDVDFVRYLVGVDKENGPNSIIVQIYDTKIKDSTGTPIPVTKQEPGFKCLNNT